MIELFLEAFGVWLAESIGAYRGVWDMNGGAWRLKALYLSGE